MGLVPFEEDRDFAGSLPGMGGHMKLGVCRLEGGSH